MATSTTMLAVNDVAMKIPSTASNVTTTNNNSSNNKTIEIEQSSDHIRVVARFRPINSAEKHEEKLNNLVDEPITLYNNGKSVNVPRINKPSLPFTLDNILWSDSTQQEAFEKLALPLIKQVLLGYNCTIFAFGQTGSGKTYTMFGPDNYSRIQQLGIIPRSIDYLFNSLKEGKDILKYQVSLSCIEVYKELTRDLLDSSKKKKRLEIFVSGKEVIIKNLRDVICNSVDDVLSNIVKAQQNRQTKQTDFIGHNSSRSHCVVTINITQRMLDDTIKTSKMNFGDLAGSELAAKTDAVGSTLKEAGKIHQGLLALENVINALVQHRDHVPYKDSKLTRILKDSLGGNSKTTLLVACSPHIWNRQETVSTLRFAARAKKIKNKARINKRRTREQLENRIKRLEELNINLKKKIKNKKKNKNNNNNNNTHLKDNNSLILNIDDNNNKLSDALSEIERLKKLLIQKEDRISQLTQDITTKDNIISDLSSSNNKKILKYENNLKKKEIEIEELENKLNDNNSEIIALKKEIENDIKLTNSFNKHRSELSLMVNSSLTDTKLATINALNELQTQQKEFYKYMKLMQTNIDKIYMKQHQHDKEFDELKKFKLLYNINNDNNDDNDDDNDDNDDFLNDLNIKILKNNNNNKKRKRLSTASIIIHPNITDNNNNDNNNNNRPISPLSKTRSIEQFGNVIDSMKSYLAKTRNGLLDNDDDKDDIDDNKNSPINIIESKTNNVNDDNDNDNSLNSNNNYQTIKTQQSQSQSRVASNSTSSFSIGKKVDVLDSSYHWYSATIIDIDVFNKKSIKIKYDGFDSKWNEWISFSREIYRISLHATKSLGYGKNKGGIHALCATKYGKSKNGKNIRLAMNINSYNDVLLSEDVSILLAGYMYKRGNWNKDWKKRYFLLKNNNNNNNISDNNRSGINLYYYENENLVQKNQYRGVISLQNIKNIISFNIKNGFTKYSFNIKTPNRLYNFSCSNDIDLKDWLSVLQCLMNNPLDIIAPQIKQLNDNNNNNYDPNRFVHRISKSMNFHRLTVTTPTSAHNTSASASFDIDNNNNNDDKILLNKKKSSSKLIGRLVRSASKLTSSNKIK